MQAISGVINKAKDGYLAAIDWMAAHLHLTFWAAVAAIAVALVL